MGGAKLAKMESKLMPILGEVKGKQAFCVITEKVSWYNFWGTVEQYLSEPLNFAYL